MLVIDVVPYRFTLGYYSFPLSTLNVVIDDTTSGGRHCEPHAATWCRCFATRFF